MKHDYLVRMPVLVDFAERLGFAEPYRILNEPALLPKKYSLII